MKILITLLNKLNIFINLLIKKIDKSAVLVKIISIEHNKLGRFLNIVISNKNMLDNYTVLPHIFKILTNNEEFINFGDYKVIIISAIIEGREIAFHHNVLIKNTTTYSEYFDKVRDYIQETYGEFGYNISTIPLFRVRVFNMDLVRNKHIKITKNATKLNKRYYSTNPILNNESLKRDKNILYIKPLKRPEELKLNKFMSMDLETVSGINNSQIPIAITSTYPSFCFAR